MSGSQVDNKATISDATGTINKFFFREIFPQKYIQIDTIFPISRKNRLPETGSYEVSKCVSMLVWQSRYVCVCVSAHIVEKWPLVPKAIGAVIYSLGQTEGQTQCHHWYFIKFWMSLHTQSRRTCVRWLLPLCETLCSFNQNHQTCICCPK